MLFLSGSLLSVVLDDCSTVHQTQLINKALMLDSIKCLRQSICGLLSSRYLVDIDTAKIHLLAYLVPTYLDVLASAIDI
jgi:hypothetical protein